MAGFSRMASLKLQSSPHCTTQAQSHFNLVPANALLGAQQNETDHRSHPLKPQHGCHGATVPCVPGHTLVRRRVDLHWVVAVTSVQRLCTVA